tara:strand:- start:92 stop:1198 length:1107 start_codon:yes stop_codon:yes gene_type:complete
MKILVTGANGFIGKNLCCRLKEKNHDVFEFTRKNNLEDLKESVSKVDFIFHLAGVNRPEDDKQFTEDNIDFTRILFEELNHQNKSIGVLITSSTQAHQKNAYGLSKLQAENIALDLSGSSNVNPIIYRLPNVFGKWCRPNYNSVVATFAYNIANDLPIEIHDKDAIIELVYIDDVCNEFIRAIDSDKDGSAYKKIEPSYKISLGGLADLIKAFKESRNNKIIEKVGAGLSRALYATYLSYLPKELFDYSLLGHEDNRGKFIEILKTKDSGQFSFFTAHPGVTRGDHYHHTKNEKFLVISGKANFKFKHQITGETHEIKASQDKFQIIESIPGWSHNITNIGETILHVFLWSNEIFDEENPDTVMSKIL